MLKIRLLKKEKKKKKKLKEKRQFKKPWNHLLSIKGRLKRDFRGMKRKDGKKSWMWKNGDERKIESTK